MSWRTFTILRREVDNFYSTRRQPAVDVDAGARNVARRVGARNAITLATLRPHPCGRAGTVFAGFGVMLFDARRRASALRSCCMDLILPTATTLTRMLNGASSFDNPSTAPVRRHG